VVRTLHHASHRVRIHRLDGSLERELPLPGIGSVGQFSGREDDPVAWFSYSSFTVPPRVFRYDLDTGERTEFARTEVDFDSSAYETRLYFSRSKDGTAIPFFLTARRGLERDGRRPTLLTGYGGFNAAMTPRFRPQQVVWLELGGILATACLRGGSEYGEEWHAAGMLDRKQNVFDDFVSVAEYLVEQQYTSPERLAIAGASNGGLLIGAVLNQRPELFGAALPAVGVMDMLRYHLFTIGWAWVPEYGSAEDPEQFAVLRRYSPLHNIRPGVEYPAVLVTTGDHDDRVVPGHSFKYAATLQAAQGGEKPVLIRVETRAGHGAGKPTWMQIEEQADRWAFLVETLGMAPAE
jgi:prolyl oligopeptidase